MRFVVCTHSYLLLVTVNNDLTIKSTRVLDEGYFDGADVTRDGELIVAARKTSPWDAKTPCELLWYDDIGRTSMPPIDGSDILDPHQISLGVDDRAIWATSTADNSIVGIPLSDSASRKKFYFNFGNDMGDWNHMNSIYTTPTNVIYTVMHNLHTQPSFMVEHCYETDSSKVGAGVMAIISKCITPFMGVHNLIVLDDNTIYYNASDDGAVIRSNWDTPEEVERAEVGENWHPKGMCMTDEYIVVGYSEHAVETPRRYISQSGLAFIDRNTWEVVATPRLGIPGSRFGLGNINEVRLYGVKSA